MLCWESVNVGWSYRQPLKWNQMYTCCIPVVYPGSICTKLYALYTVYGEMCTIYIRFVSVKPMWQCQHMQCVDGVQSINAVKGVDIMVRSCSNEMKWDEYRPTSEYLPRDINPVICWNSSNMQYIPGVYLLKCPGNMCQYVIFQWNSKEMQYT